MVRKKQSRVQSRGLKVALYALLLLTLNSQLSTTWAQSQAYRIANLNNIRFADQFPGADAGEKIANCIADLPATGGTCDARGLEGAQTISSTLTIDKPINLLLGAASYTLSSGVRIDLTSNEVAIIGLGRSATAINSPSAAEAIRLGALAGSSVSRCALKDLTVTKTGTVREAGSIGIVQYGGQSNRYEYIQVISFEKGILLDGDGGDVPMVEVPMESVRLSQNLIGLDMTTPITTVFSRGMVIVGPGQATVGSFGIRQENDVGQGGYFSQTTMDIVETGIQQGGNLWFYAGLRLESITNGITWAGGAADSNSFFGVHDVNVTTVVATPPAGATQNVVERVGRLEYHNSGSDSSTARVFYDGGISRISEYYDPNFDRLTWRKVGIEDFAYMNYGQASFQLGPTPATSGRLGLTNGDIIRWRTSSNDGNVDVLKMTNGDVVVVSQSGVQTDIAGTLRIGSGTAISNHFSATASLDFTALAANTCEVLTIAVTGAADADTVTLGLPNALADVDGATQRTVFFGWVSAADVVSVRRCNVTGTATADPASATVRADVWKH